MRARARPAPAESGEASKVRHDEQTAHRMVDLISSHLVGRLRLKTRYKSDFSIAQTTAQQMCTCVHKTWPARVLKYLAAECERL